MYCVLTDGSVIAKSATLLEIELQLLNYKAKQATDNTWVWEVGNLLNARLPKAEYYHHIKRQDIASIL